MNCPPGSSITGQPFREATERSKLPTIVSRQRLLQLGVNGHHFEDHGNMLSEGNHFEFLLDDEYPEMSLKFSSRILRQDIEIFNDIFFQNVYLRVLTIIGHPHISLNACSKSNWNNILAS
jgi:hypothetical protein